MIILNLKIIGGGLGDLQFLTRYAEQIIKNLDIVITTKRIYKNIESLNNNIIIMNLSEISEKIDEYAEDNISIGIIVSGDVGFYSFSETLKNKYANIELVNGINCMQYMLTKLNKSYNDVKALTLHGRNEIIIPYVCYNKKLFVLTGGKNKVDTIINKLSHKNIHNLFIAVGENLSYENEKISLGDVEYFKGKQFSELSVIYIENKNYRDYNENLLDSDFIRSKIPMTKQEVRDICLAKLNIKSKDIIYDIGAGTGSMSVCIARKVYENHMYSIEKNDDAIQLIKQNIQKFNTHNIEIVRGKAPYCLKNLPSPDKIFIGGTDQNLKEILDICLAKNKNLKIVLTAITLETLFESINYFKSKNIHYDIISVNISISNKIGDYNLMKANNPIFIINAN